jgi:hypothetical protein
MKYILILSYYLVTPGDHFPDVHQTIHPTVFETVRECQFMKDIIEDMAEKAYGPGDYISQCLGVE